MTGLGRRSRLALKASIIVILLAGGAYLLRCFVQGISVMKHADMAYGATFRATEAVEKYVREQRKWPASWKDLESVSATGGTDFLPPGGWDEIRAYVEINFNLTLGDVAKQRVEDFDAIKPVEPIWGGYRAYFAPLLETVRSVQGAQRGSAKGPQDASQGPSR